MDAARLFSHGGSQAVRLPKAYRFEGAQVYVRRVGNDVVLSPMPPTDADELAAAIEFFDASVPIAREQPAEQVRALIRPIQSIRPRR